MNEKKNQIGNYAYLGIYFVTYVLTRIYGNGSTTSLYLQLIRYIVMGIWGVVLLRPYYQEGLRRWKTDSWHMVLWMVGALVVDMVLTSIASIPAYLYAPEYESLNSGSMEKVAGILPLWLTLLCLGICGPLVEEHIFRALMLRKKEGRLLILASITGSAFCFMLIHVKALTVEELLINLPQFATGLTYGFVARKSKNITIPILLHLINNLIAIISIYTL